MKFVQWIRGTAFWWARTNWFAGGLQTALACPRGGTRKTTSSVCHVHWHGTMGWRAHHKIATRRSRQTWTFRFAFWYFSATTRLSIRTFGASSRPIGFVNIPIVFYNWHHERHLWFQRNKKYKQNARYSATKKIFSLLWKVWKLSWMRPVPV